MTEYDVELLKTVHRKCTQKYEGRHSSPLFGVNVHLEPSELEEVRKLVQAARAAHDSFTKREDVRKNWETFQKELEKLRNVYGTFNEVSRVIVRDGKDVLPAKRGEVHAVLVPKDIRKLYDWHLKIRSVEEDFRRITRGLAKGTSATAFGKSVYELHYFVRESKPR